MTRIYRRDDVKKQDWKLIGEVRYPAVQIEGVCWDGRDLVLVAEGASFALSKRPRATRRRGQQA